LGACDPERLPGKGFQLSSGIRLDLRTYTVSSDLPGLVGFDRVGQPERRRLVETFLAERGGAAGDSEAAKLDLLKHAIQTGLARPYSRFLQDYLEEIGWPNRKFRSVVVGIPLASVAAYQLPNLEAVCRLMGIADEDRIEELKDFYLANLCEDLAQVQRELADNVYVAHTTAVGGMYDEDADGTIRIRLGFAHSAQDERLIYKQKFAAKLTRLYAERGINIMVTAAAIGIDKVFVRKVAPLHAGIHRQLNEAALAGRAIVPSEDLTSRRLRAYPPLTLKLRETSEEPVAFQHGRDVVSDYAFRSGENGFFSIANADALYRVMRVASCSELAAVLAQCALSGDDPGCPLFPDHVCYYTETDNSRQVFDFLSQPVIFRKHISGLSPQALQDLGSSKHQGELHTLNLLILLHRLRTLNIDAIRHDVNVEQFDPVEFFETNSRRLTFEDVVSWEAERLAHDLRILVTANHYRDLAPLCSLSLQSIPARNQAYERVMREVLHAVWSVPSIGSPVVYEHRGVEWVRTGYFAAPLELVLERRDSLHQRLRREFEELGGGTPEDFTRFLNYHIANNGFIDLRPLAVLNTSRKPQRDLSGSVFVAHDEAQLRELLGRVAPHSYFTTSGMIALLTRLRGLYESVSRSDIELGTLNEFRAHFPRDETGHIILVPGIVEAARMYSEGLEKNTGTSRIDGIWGYFPRAAITRSVRPEA
jgi:hypothetical protein